jgi:alpha-glucosidase
VGPRSLPAHEDANHPHWDRPGVHAIYQAWRKVADSYADPRIFVAEAWVHPGDRLARYVRSDELHTAFNFDYLVAPWRAEQLRASINGTLAAHAEVGAPPTWVLSNHDVAREVSRYARPQTAAPLRWLDDLLAQPADFALGLQRARAAALLMLALPGGAYIYQGEELGLPEVEDLPDAVLQDPMFAQTGRKSRGRDGCRVPIPWEGAQPHFGFSPPSASAPPWLPQPAAWAALSVSAQTGVEGSTLELYRKALQLRRSDIGLGGHGLQWLPSPEGALVFTRGSGFVCMVNVSAEPLARPAGAHVLLNSGALDTQGRVPADTTVWLQI